MVGNANANGIPFLKRYGIPPAIKNSMVLWYDIAKQGATNESMAENPILKDLSGNGHDITCYNFAWSGMSGIGGYATNWRNYTNYKDRATYTLTQNKLHITNVTATSNIIETNTNSNPIDSVIKEYKVKITGLDKLNEQGNSAQVKYRKNQDEKISISFDKDGTYTIEENVISTPYSDGYAIYNYVGDCDITIEQLPQYPNALVSDGVDDYASFSLSQNLFNRNTTYIAKYIKISDTGKWQYLFDVSNPDGSTDTDYPNRLYVGNPSNTDNYYGYSDNIIQNDGIVIIGKPREFTYTYTPHFSLFASNSKDNFANAALYSLILFNRTLTADEIEWVKANLINGYPTPNVYYDCSLYTNETVDSTNPVLKDLSGHGHDLVLKNFAFAGMSGFGGYISNRNVDKWYKPSNNNGTYIIKENTIHISKLNTNKQTYYVTYNGGAANEYIELRGNTYTTKPFNIKISGLPEGKQVRIYGIAGGNNVSTSNIAFPSQYFNNGTFTVESVSLVWENDIQPDLFNFPSFFINSDTADDVDITIELIPQYPNALVFDGVDDYGAGTRDSFDKCTMLMLFKPTEWQDGISVDLRDTVKDAFAIYRNDQAKPYIAYNARNVNGTYINNKLNSTLTVTDTMNKKHLITVKGKIFNTNDFCVGSNYTHNNYFDRMALYKFLLFDQELTQEQIDKVIQDYHLMDDVDDVWNQ